MIWNEQNQSYLYQNWKAVEQQTNQPFNYALLEKETFEYDTYPACKAIVTVRELWGEIEAFDYITKIQRAFYREGQDITQLEILSRYIDEEDKEVFLNFYQSERAELLMLHDFSKARSMGANAFPSIVKIDKDGHMVCKKGYQKIEEILTL